ncbi:DsbA family protein [Candidatus Parcubacteria bacterium]|nr:MAG: DsbA family protein [Candidatus Parcubacteria bacterium]
MTTSHSHHSAHSTKKHHSSSALSSRQKTGLSQNSLYFIFGLSVGVAIVSLIAFGLIFYLLRSNMTIGTIPNSDALSADSTKDVPVPSPNNQPSRPPLADSNNSNSPTPLKENIKVSITAQDHIRGPQNAPITLVEYSDIQCPFCKRFHNTLKELLKRYPNKIRWVYRHFPLDSLHPYARKAAQASECAGEQGKFWEYLDYLFDNQSSINEEFLSQAAKQIGLNTDKFIACLQGGKYIQKVTSDQLEGQKSGVRGTPGSVINGKFYRGALPVNQLSLIIEQELKAAK